MQFRTEENYIEIQNALSDFDCIVKDQVLRLEELEVWLENNNELQGTCLEARYFNSCFQGFPCAHTEDNVEYQFSLFYFRVFDLKKWFELNSISEKYLIQLLRCSPETLEEIEFIGQIREKYGLALDEILNLNWNSESDWIEVELCHFNFGVIRLLKKDLMELRKLSKEYGKVYG